MEQEEKIKVKLRGRPIHNEMLDISSDEKEMKWKVDSLFHIFF